MKLAILIEIISHLPQKLIELSVQFPYLINLYESIIEHHFVYLNMNNSLTKPTYSNDM